MPDEVKYTLRMQEYVIQFILYLFYTIYCRNGPYYYHAQQVKLSDNDYLWRRSPKDFCRGD
jgi:hypothetical protein